MLQLVLARSTGAESIHPSGPSDVVTDETDVVDDQLAAHRRSCRSPVSHQTAGPCPQKPWTDVPDDLVDQIGPQEGGRERRPALEEDVVNVASKQVIENRARRRAWRTRACRSVASQYSCVGRQPRVRRRRRVAAGRGNGAPCSSRAVSCGSSASTVPVPTMTASTAARSRCASARDVGAADPSAASRRLPRPDRPGSQRTSR